MERRSLIWEFKVEVALLVSDRGVSVDQAGRAWTLTRLRASWQAICQ